MIIFGNFLKKWQFLAIFLIFEWQFSGGSSPYQTELTCIECTYQSWGCWRGSWCRTCSPHKPQFQTAGTGQNSCRRWCQRGRIPSPRRLPVMGETDCLLSALVSAITPLVNLIYFRFLLNIIHKRRKYEEFSLLDEFYYFPLSMQQMGFTNLDLIWVSF